ncbi:hypothetical protein [Lentzea sp. NPDC059081]|uniref:hypothetical protein n=1 Tax=Lentzea sp. NPDC059081 TaxID=3346719 RepID=UPI00369E9FB6
MTDDELRDRMRRADPAASLRPLPDGEVRRLVAGAERRPVAPRVSSLRLPVLVGAAAAVAVAAGALVVTGGDAPRQPSPPVALPTTTPPGLENGQGLPDTSGGRPTTGRTVPNSVTPLPSPPMSPSSPAGRKTTVVVLTEVPEDPRIRCRAPEAGVLQESAQMAFEGTVLRIDGDVVTLQVRRAWRGDADVLEVRNATGAPVLVGFEPEVGRTFLVAASDMRVLGCGLSGPDEPGLRGIYDEAFR